MRCEWQNIPLRDRRHSGSRMDILRDETVSHGKLSALMECRVEAPWRQSYILGDHIGEQIIAKVENAGWFSVIAGEVTDSSNKQQLCLVVRYVDPEEGFARQISWTL